MKELIEAGIDNRIMVDEIIGADERCTNITARTFGLCSGEPLMNWSDFTNLLSQGFSDNEIYVYRRYPVVNLKTKTTDDFVNQIEKNILDRKSNSLSWDDIEHSGDYYLTPSGRGNVYPNLEGVMLNTTINQVVQTIKNQKALGQFVFSVRSHVLSLHYTNQGTYIVDTEEKFISRKQVERFLVVDSNKARTAFKNYLQNNPNSSKIKKV